MSEILEDVEHRPSQSGRYCHVCADWWPCRRVQIEQLTKELAAAVAERDRLRAALDDRQGYIHSEFHDYEIKWTECPRLICVDTRAALSGQPAGGGGEGDD